jgi:hypothetical protein
MAVIPELRQVFEMAQYSSATVNQQPCISNFLQPGVEQFLMAGNVVTISDSTQFPK